MTEGEGGYFGSKLRDVIYECPLMIPGKKNERKTD